MGGGEVARQAAGADHDQMAGVLARQIVGGEGGGRRRAPRGQLAAVDHRHHLAGAGIVEKVARHHCRQAARAVARHHRRQLGAEIASRHPGRHQQQRAVGLARYPELVMVPHRALAALAEHRPQRLDQRPPFERVAGGILVELQHGSLHEGAGRERTDHPPDRVPSIECRVCTSNPAGPRRQCRRAWGPRAGRKRPALRRGSPHDVRNASRTAFGIAFQQ